MGSDWRTVSAVAIDESRRDGARAYFVAVATTQCKPMCAMPVSIVRGYARGTMTEAVARRAQVEPSLTTAESDTGLLRIVDLPGETTRRLSLPMPHDLAVL
jgi:hypothetical protein